MDKRIGYAYKDVICLFDKTSRKFATTVNIVVPVHMYICNPTITICTGRLILAVIHKSLWNTFRNSWNNERGVDVLIECYL